MIGSAADAPSAGVPGKLVINGLYPKSALIAAAKGTSSL